MPGSAHPGDPWASVSDSLARNPTFPSSSQGNAESRFHKPTQETQACPFPELRVPCRTLVSQAGCLLVPPPGPRCLDPLAQPRGPLKSRSLLWAKSWELQTLVTSVGLPHCDQIVPPFASPTFWLEQPAATYLGPGRLALDTGPRRSCPWSALSVAWPPPSPATAAREGGSGGVGDPSSSPRL